MNITAYYPERASLEGVERYLFQFVSVWASPEQWDAWLRVPLELAAALGDLGLVDMLIGAGANGRAGWRGCGAPTLLHAAAVGGSEGVVASLLKAGAQPDVNVVPSAPPCLPALYLAATNGHEAVARRLILAGADVDFKHPVYGYTVLHEAIYGRRERLAEDLMMSGADIMARTSKGCTPLHLAVEEGLEGVVSTLLLRGADKDAVDNEGDSALMWACGSVKGAEPNLAVVETLLTAGVDVHIRRPSDGFSALDFASLVGWVSILQALVRYGANVNSCCSDHFSALHVAASNGQAGAVDALVEAGADIDLRSNDGRRPLSCAAGDGIVNAVLALLHHGASVDARDIYDRTPMHMACFSKLEGFEVVVDLLLRWGADETAVDEDGETPADDLDAMYENRTCSQDEIERVRLLLDRAPADRAWRRRGWLVMLRTQASKARNDSHEGSRSKTVDVSNAAGGGVEDDRKMVRHPVVAGNASGERGEDSQEADGFEAEDGVGGNEALRGVVEWLERMEPAGVFRTILGFL